ncbi:hypothetical protein ES332_A05G110200v1 [Gossypium tomentosum]|uniref:Uncharacterized protein n=1 Tax=Gossypium tomentosum TaxID=34277 RepID=A0A5D2QDF8_GOSTO|nr:hypothetical protein ES332_A05G110200v1 [Gossypium tomentosum]
MPHRNSTLHYSLKGAPPTYPKSTSAIPLGH